MPRPGRHTRFTDDQIIAALRVNAGIQTMAARTLEKEHKRPCGLTLLNNRIQRSPKLKAISLEILERNLDLAEGKLLEQINGGNTQAIIFFLSTKGKNRGFTKRIEQTGPGGGPLQHRHEGTPNFGNMTAEEADAYLAARSAGPETV